MSFCSNCGQKLPDTAKFCRACGAPVQVVNQAPAAPVSNGPMELFFNMEKGSFVNYHMAFTDSTGRLVFDAKTVSESFMGYTMRAWAPNGSEAFTVKTTKGGLNTLRFVLLDASRNPICDIVQKVVKNAYAYELPEFGIFAQGDFFNSNFRVERQGGVIAEVLRNATFAKDSYTVQIYDRNALIPILGIVFAVQLDTIARRRHRR